MRKGVKSKKSVVENQAQMWSSVWTHLESESYQNTASSLHLEQDCTKNQVSSFIDEEFSLKMATTQEEEHVCTTNTVLLQNTGSTHEEQINANTIDKIFLEVCVCVSGSCNRAQGSLKLAPPSDDELLLSSLLPRGFKMKKGVKSEKSVTKNRRITRSRKN